MSEAAATSPPHDEEAETTIKALMADTSGLPLTAYREVLELMPPKAGSHLKENIVLAVNTVDRMPGATQNDRTKNARLAYGVLERHGCVVGQSFCSRTPLGERVLVALIRMPEGQRPREREESAWQAKIDAAFERGRLVGFEEGRQAALKEVNQAQEERTALAEAETFQRNLKGNVGILSILLAHDALSVETAISHTAILKPLSAPYPFERDIKPGGKEARQVENPYHTSRDVAVGLYKMLKDRGYVATREVGRITEYYITEKGRDAFPGLRDMLSEKEESAAKETPLTRLMGITHFVPHAYRPGYKKETPATLKRRTEIGILFFLNAGEHFTPNSGLAASVLERKLSPEKDNPFHVPQKKIYGRVDTFCRDLLEPESGPPLIERYTRPHPTGTAVTYAITQEGRRQLPDLLTQVVETENRAMAAAEGLM